MNKLGLVVIDGDCAFCRSCAAYLKRHDKKNRLSIEFHQEDLHDNPLKSEGVSSVRYIRDGNTYLYDEAVLRILSELGIMHRLLSIALRIIPGALRKSAYRFIAKRRKKLFTNSSC